MDPLTVSRRELALRDLERLAQGRDPEQQTALMRFTQCPDWQKAAELILGALHAASGQRKGTRLAAPPAWLPPI